MYCIIQFIVQGKQARVKNADLRHPSLHSCNVKTQIYVTRPQCVNYIYCRCKHVCLTFSVIQKQFAHVGRKLVFPQTTKILCQQMLIFQMPNMTHRLRTCRYLSIVLL